MAFSQAIQFIKEKGGMDKLEDKFITSDRVCSTSSDSLPVLEIMHVQGLLIIVGFVAIVGLVVGLLEHITAFCVAHFSCCKGLDEVTVNLEDENGGGTAEADTAGDGAEKLEDASVLAPPPDIDENADLSLGDAVLELQTRLDRIEDLLQAAVDYASSAVEAGGAKGDDGDGLGWLKGVTKMGSTQ
mmetsp:Transcript_13330/g.30938  ORF Transcript_13330/g.30938 Transcript_13330/m.30938 type:complete len:186 (+) Transcript_13330:55-612(+)